MQLCQLFKNTQRNFPLRKFPEDGGVSTSLSEKNNNSARNLEINWYKLEEENSIFKKNDF